MSKGRGELERHFLPRVRELAETCGWTVYHTHRSQHSPAGFPDLTMIGPPGRARPSFRRLLFAELKRDDEEPTLAQAWWLLALAETGVEVYCWRPSDWPRIVEVLT